MFNLIHNVLVFLTTDFVEILMYPTFILHLYEAQENWIKGTTIEDINQNLKKTIKKFGLSEKNFDKCLDLEDVENHILNSRIEAVKNFKINSTPKVIINDKVFEDTLEYKNLKRFN